MKKKVHLNKLCFSRSGDKGDLSNIGLMAKTDEAYGVIKQEVTAQKVKEHFRGLCEGDVKLWPMDNLNALEIVLLKALGGGATRTLRFDQTGKAMCGALLRMEIEADEAVIQGARDAEKEIFEKYRDW